MLFFPVSTNLHPRQSPDSSPTPLPVPKLVPSAAEGSSNSHGIISFADPHHLNPIESYRSKKDGGGRGVPPHSTPIWPKLLSIIPCPLNHLQNAPRATPLFSNRSIFMGGGVPPPSFTNLRRSSCSGRPVHSQLSVSTPVSRPQAPGTNSGSAHVTLLSKLSTGTCRFSLY